MFFSLQEVLAVFFSLLEALVMFFSLQEVLTVCFSAGSLGRKFFSVGVLAVFFSLFLLAIKRNYMSLVFYSYVYLKSPNGCAVP